MKKLSKNEDKLIALFVLKSFVFSLISLILFTLLFSFIIYKLDLGEIAEKVFSVLIIIFSCVSTSFLSLGSIKNNASLIGILSIIPILLYSIFNLIFNENTIMLFCVKCLLAILFGALSGIIRVNYNKRLKV